MKWSGWKSVGYGSANRLSRWGIPPGPSSSGLQLDLQEGAEDHFSKLTPMIGSLGGLSGEISRLQGLRAWVLEFPDSCFGSLSFHLNNCAILGK